MVGLLQKGNHLKLVKTKEDLKIHQIFHLFRLWSVTTGLVATSRTNLCIKQAELLRLVPMVPKMDFVFKKKNKQLKMKMLQCR